MNSKKCKALRKLLRIKGEAAVYEDKQNGKPKQCGFKTQTLPSGTSVTVPHYVTTATRRLSEDSARRVYQVVKGSRLLTHL